MASIQERVATNVNLAIERAAKKTYRQNVKLSPKEVAHLMEIHLRRLLDKKTNAKGIALDANTLAQRLILNAVLEVDKFEQHANDR